MKPQKRIRGGKVRWVARYVGSDGKERSRTFEREKDAKAWITDNEQDVRRGDWIDPRAGDITVGQLWQRWEQAAHTDGTRGVRHRVGKNLGRLEGIPVGKLRPSDVREWYHALRNGRPWVKGCEGLAPTTVATWSGQLAGCMSLAVSDGHIKKSPCDGVFAKRGRKSHAVTADELITADQVLDMVREAREGRSGTKNWVPPHPTLARMIIVGAATGLRAGEIAGLRIRSVDFLRREMSVVEQSTSKTATFEWGPLKSDSSKRVLPLPKVAIEALAEELAANPCSDRSRPIFRTSRGQMWTASTLAYSIRSVRQRCGLGEEVTWHSLRHFYASTLIFSGASVKTVQSRLGHESPSTTLETYAHMWPGEDERTRDAVDALLRRDQSGTDPEEDGSTPDGKVADLA